VNAAYLVAKGCNASGRTQIAVMGTAVVLVTGFFITRLSFPILVAPAVALYLLSRSKRVDAVTGRRLRACLGMALVALALTLLVYRRILPKLLDSILDVYVSLISRHPYVLAAVLVAALLVCIAAARPFRARVEAALDPALSLAERATLWLPLAMVL